MYCIGGVGILGWFMAPGNMDENIYATLVPDFKALRLSNLKVLYCVFLLCRETGREARRLLMRE